MSNEGGERSIEELESMAERGEMDDGKGWVIESIAGEMQAQSLRLPADVIEAFRRLGDRKHLGHTSLMRTALVEWLNENHQGILETLEDEKNELTTT